MSRRFDIQYPLLASTSGIIRDPVRGITLAVGTTVPSDGATGYAPGCLFQDIDAAAGAQLWVNEGTRASSSFKSMTLTMKANGELATILTI